MNCIKHEKLYHISEAAQLSPGRPPSRATLLRWMKQGLEHIRIGGQVYISAEAMDRYIDKCNPHAS